MNTASNSGDAFTHEILEILAGHTALPYLFVGSGMSRRYLDLPDWPGLLRLFAAEAGVDFGYLFSSAEGDLPILAGKLAALFHEVWWSDAKYADSRVANSGKVVDRQMALKVEIARYITAKSELGEGTPGVDRGHLREEIEHFKRVVIGGVITTNYDRLIGQIFPEFPAYVGQQELLLSDAQFVAETYKIHGAVEDPGSLVLTDHDYAQFERRDKYLAAKLLTIFAEHPVLFLGYSIEDPNILKILENICCAVGSERISELGDRMFYVEWDENVDSPSIETYVVKLENGLIPLRRIRLNSFSPLFLALGRLEPPMPAQVIRMLTKHVYDIVRDPNVTRQPVVAVPINSPGAENLKVIFGVGPYEYSDIEGLSAVGLRGIDRRRVVQDVLGDKPLSADPNQLLSEAFPEVLKRASFGYVPIFKYLARAKRINRSGKVDVKGLPVEIANCIDKNRTMKIQESAKRRFHRDVEDSLGTPAGILRSDLSDGFKMECLVLLDPSGFELDDLRDALLTVLRTDDSLSKSTGFYRAVCHYDRLTFDVEKSKS
ncbi:SIR2 family protein [Rhodococcus sp. 1163]|uniref:SIR2 family protein n=1 Tax=Rhodococcus sp. 1163 TaxID=1905289 RepID=UPI00117A9214|nr:SIR2 family protein [Rhodococcus sp. 1163]